MIKYSRLSDESASLLNAVAARIANKCHTEEVIPINAEFLTSRQVSGCRTLNVFWLISKQDDEGRIIVTFFNKQNYPMASTVIS